MRLKRNDASKPNRINVRFFLSSGCNVPGFQNDRGNPQIVSVEYRKVPLISPRVIQLRKGFLAGKQNTL